MKIAYVDESFDVNGYALGALIVDEAQLVNITHRINELALRLQSEHGLPSDAEFHGYDMFHHDNAWAVLASKKRVLIQAINTLIDAVLAEQPAMYIVEILRDRLTELQDRNGYPTRHTPEHQAWMFLLQRVDGHAQTCHQKVLVIADEVPEDERRRRDDYNKWKSQGTPGAYMRTQLEGLIDVPAFVPSSDSRMVQAVDVLLFHYMRAIRSREKDDRAQAVIDGIRDRISAAGMNFTRWP